MSKILLTIRKEVIKGDKESIRTIGGY